MWTGRVNIIALTVAFAAEVLGRKVAFDAAPTFCVDAPHGDHRRDPKGRFDKGGFHVHIFLCDRKTLGSSYFDPLEAR